MRVLSRGAVLTALVAGAYIFANPAAHASASSVMGNLTFTTSPTNSNGTLTGWSFVGTVPDFADAGGTCTAGDTCALTGITIVISDLATGNVVFTGPNNPNGTYTGDIGAEIDYLSPIDASLQRTTAEAAVCTSGVSLSSSGSINCGGLGNQTLSFAANQAIQATLVSTPTSTATLTSTSPAVLTTFDTADQMFNGTTTSSVSGNNVNNVATSPALTAFISGTVTYTYTDTAPPPPTPAPEPASMAMLGFGLVGLGIARRRIRRT